MFKARKVLLVGILLSLHFSVLAQQEYEFKVVTVVESVVPGGLARSRIMKEKERIKIKNFFSIGGINFGNIEKNDTDIAVALNNMSSKGWELFSVNSGVYSGVAAGVTSGSTSGIFITRYLFRKAKF